MRHKDKYRFLLRNTIIFALGSLGTKLILFILVPFYTNYLTTSEYGTADLVSTFSQLIIPVVSLVINEAVIRFGMKKREKKESVVLCAFVILGLSTILTISITPIIGLYSFISPWKWYLCLCVVFSCFLETEYAYLKVKNKNGRFALISVMQTTILALINILTISIYHLGIEGYLIANIASLGSAVLITFFAAGLHRDLRGATFDKDLLKKMVAYSSPLILNNVSWGIIHSSDKIMIEVMLNVSLLGVYTAATKIPSLINVITGIFTQAWGLSSIREVESSNDGTFYTAVFDYFNTVIVGACIIIITIIKPFMYVFVGDEFRDAWQFAPLLLAAAVFYSISSYFGALYAAAEKTIYNMWSTIICAIANILLNFIFIKVIGVWGAVIGTVVSYFLIAHIRMIGIRKYMPVSFCVFEYVASVFLMMLQSVLVSLGWNIYIVSAVTIIIFILIKRKMICKIIKFIINKVFRKA